MVSTDPCGTSPFPRFSIVIAKASAFFVFCILRMTFLLSQSKSPRFLGFPSINAHSWYCFSEGSLGRFLTTRYTLCEAVSQYISAAEEGVSVPDILTTIASLGFRPVCVLANKDFNESSSDSTWAYELESSWFFE